MPLLAAAQKNSTCRDIANFPLGVLDLPSHVAYVSVGNAIQAVNVDTGTTIWERPGIGWPLWKEDNALIVLSGSADGKGLSIQFVGAQNGVPKSEAEPFRVPESDARSILESQQRPEVEIRGDNLYLRWNRNARYRGGANPPFNRSLRSTTDRGVAKINLISEESELSDDFPSDAHHACAPGKDQSTLLYFRNCQESCDSWTVENTKVRLIRNGDAMAIVLTSPNTPGSRVVKLRGALDPQPYVTADGKYILVQEKQNGSARMLVYSAATGDEMGEIADEVRSSDATLIGSILYYVSSSSTPFTSSLHAVALPKGESLWHRTISFPSSEMEPKLPR